MNNVQTAKEWFENGVTAGQLGRYEEALEAFNHAVELDVQDARAWYNKGVALSKLGRDKEALEAYDKALQIKPDYSNQWYAKAWYYKGIQLGWLGRYEEELEALAKAITYRPNYAEAWYNRAVALGQLDRHEEELDAYDKALGIYPNYAEAWYNKAIVLGWLERYEEELEALAEVIKYNPDNAEAWYNQALALDRLGHHLGALDAYHKAIEIDPNYALAHGNLAEVLFNLGDLKQANTSIERAIGLDGKLTSALLLKGRIEIERKNYGGASQSFTQAIASDLGNPFPVLWNAYARYLQAEFCHQPNSREYQEELFSIIGQLERASEAIKKDDRELRAYILYFLGCFYYQTRDTFEATRKLTECVTLKSESIEPPARELLNNIWDRVIKPPWWRWWLFSPLNRGLRRIIFGIISSLVVALLFIHPFLTAWFPELEINPTVVVALILFLLLLLALPSIEYIRAREFEVKLRSSTTIERVFSPLMMRSKMKELERTARVQRLQTIQTRVKELQYIPWA